MLGVVGDLLEDIVVWMTEPVQRATDTDVVLHRSRGGSAANVAAVAAGMYPTRFIGRVGTDAVGEGLVGTLAATGVDVRVQRAGETGTVVVLVDEQGERTMFPHRAAAGELADVDPTWTDGVELLHVPAYAFAAEPVATTAVELMRRVGVTSVDASSAGMLRHYGVPRFLALLDELRPRFLFANSDEADCLGSAVLPDTTVVVKDGASPTTVRPPGEQAFQVPVPPVEHIRDLTGAGDAFAAGFLTAHLQGADLRTACETGHATAAKVLTHPGAGT